MSWAMSRDDQLAASYAKLHALSATIAGLEPGSPSRTGLQAKADATWAEMQRLEASRSISPRLLLVVVGITALLLWNLLTSGH
ncbi:hypothetical protein [Kitasatospora purpeofusca]|uniref:hypothetical protein n=1 Tax=Kitasatospora purpeofusca TaxID=67352 RepID=UPI002256BB70|nr:hypothetical protein [Kitasatospora purpeofusca]MCX4690760.1 hypothetical protein [Kitasatospora purpeofusca]WSR46021.1 hypothetical protein OG196_43770 [Kitasatospora purpeofusca]